MDSVLRMVRSFELKTGDLGAFPSRGAPRVLWVGLGEGEVRLKSLHKELERGFQGAGLEKAAGSFRPHLTLARWGRHPQAVPSSFRLQSAALPPVLSFMVEEVVLVKSVLGPRGATYTRLKSVPLS